MTILEVDYIVEMDDDELEPLRMEHFYFPGGLWLIGILLSVLALLAEIIIRTLRKSKTDVAIEKPGVTKSTLESAM